MATTDVENVVEGATGEKSESSAKAAANAQVTIRQTDMPPDMQKDAIAVAIDALNTSAIEKDMATKIKQAFDAKYPKSTWHCVVGKHYAASISHQTNFEMFMSINGQTIMLFKSQD
ncbi:Dynein light chain [Plasmodiophora brassicae]